MENQLYVKAEKCEFHVPKISSLGSIFEAGRIRLDPSKIEAVTKWEPPSNRKKLQQFLGFANFLRKVYSKLQSYCPTINQVNILS